MLALRHLQQLSTNKTARVVSIYAPAAGKCGVRALKRLKDILDILPGSMGEF